MEENERRQTETLADIANLIRIRAANISDGGVMADGRVKDALRRYTVIRLQAEDISELRRLPGFERVQGLPAFLVFE